MRPAVAKLLLCKVWGWKIDNRPIEDPKCIILGFPHTCIADYFVFYLYMKSLGDTPNVMMKKEFFKWPLAPVLKWLGAIPVDRSRGAGALKHTIEELRSRERFHVALAPEGTRKKVKRWKSGFHILARLTGAPVYLGYYDWKNRYITRGEPFPLTRDAEADMLAIQKFYKHSPASGKYPEKVGFADEVD